jgi:hypothetical protein
MCAKLSFQALFSICHPGTIENDKDYIMKKSCWVVAGIGLFTAQMVCAQLSGFSGGDGTQDDPWQISTSQDLEDLRLYCGPQYATHHFAIMNDIEINQYITGPSGWTPIGWHPNNPDYFYGNLNGRLHTIYGIKLDNENCETGLGLFWGIKCDPNAEGGSVIFLTMDGEAQSNATVRVDWKGLLAARVEGAAVWECYATGEFRADGDVNGGIAGYTDECTQIVDSSSSLAWLSRGAPGTVSGGLVGENWGRIAGSAASIEGRQHSTTDTVTGGLVGINHGVGTIAACTTAQDLSTQAGNIGGIAGENDGCIMEASAKGDVTGVSTNIGGIAGVNRGWIDYTTADGDVIVSSPGSGINVGGLVGNNITVDEIATITHSHATGNIVGGDSYLGGLVGKNTQGSIERCSASGTVLGGTNCIGGLVGVNIGEESGNLNGKIDDSDAYGATGNAQACWVGGLVGLNRGIVFNSRAEGSVTGNQWVGGLVGELTHPAYIERSSALGNVEAVSLDGSNGRFVGGLVGMQRGSMSVIDSHAEGNVTGDEDVGGLVGLVMFHGRISNGYATGTVSGRANVGGLVGNGDGMRAEYVYATGNVTGGDGSSNVGGLIGCLETGKVDCAYARGDVTGASNVGGLVGHLKDGQIDHAYAWGDVAGVTDVGGWVGLHDGNAQLCETYAVGNVTGTHNSAPFAGHSLPLSAITESYYRDEQVTPANGIGTSPNPPGLYGKFGAQMRQEETFVNWDFDSIWCIQENVGYPVFQWSRDLDESNPNPRNTLTVAPLRITGITVATNAASGRDVTLTWSPDTGLAWTDYAGFDQIRYVFFESTTNLAAAGGGWEPYRSGPTPDGLSTRFPVPPAEPNRFFRAKAVLQ